MGGMGGTSDAEKYFYMRPLGPVNRSLFCFEPVPGEGLMRSNCAIMGAPDTRDWRRWNAERPYHTRRVAEYTLPDHCSGICCDDAVLPCATKASSSTALRILIDSAIAPAHVRAAAVRRSRARRESH